MKGVFKYPCNECNYKASSQSSLLQHIQVFHDIVEPKFTQRVNLNQHKKSIHKGVQYPCNFTATERLTLNGHIKFKHGNVKYPCYLCDYEATQKRCLNAHKKSRHEGIDYTCDKCDYKATQQSSLKTHKKSKQAGSCKKLNIQLKNSF